MEELEAKQPQVPDGGASQRFYVLEQLGNLANTIRMLADAIQAYRGQIDNLLNEKSESPLLRPIVSWNCSAVSW